MKKKNMIELADYIEQLDPKNFDMTTISKCGTPACIAGHAAFLSVGQDQSKYGVIVDAMGAAREWLGLDISDEKTFFLDYDYRDYSGITPEKAAVVIRKCAELDHVPNDVWSEFNDFKRHQ